MPMRGKQLHLFGDENKSANNRRYSVILPLDTLVLLSVVLVLLLTLSFSLGVERGRKTAYQAIKIEQNAAGTEPKESLQSELEAMLSSAPAIEEKEAKELRNAEKPKEEEQTQRKHVASNTDTGFNDKKYLIQVASYLTKEPAQAEAQNLEKNGYPTFVSQKGKYLVVFVGEFQDKTEAQNNMQSLKKKYKDCFLRKL